MVEPDPSDESLRRSLLGMIEHAGLRAQMAQGPLKSVEQLIVASDPVAYEEWFAKQPKPPFPPMTGLPDSIKADIEAVTRHNPPWMRGPYLSYYRPPVPAHLFTAEAANDPAPATAPAPAAPAAVPGIPELRARLARLLDRDAAAPARGAGPGGGGLRHQVAEMAGLSRPDRPRPAAARAAGHRHRREDAELARRPGDRARVPERVSRPWS